MNKRLEQTKDSTVHKQEVMCTNLDGFQTGLDKLRRGIYLLMDISLKDL